MNYERTAEYQALKAAYDATTAQLSCEGYYNIPAAQPSGKTWRAHVTASRALDAYVAAHETRGIRELMMRAEYEAGTYSYYGD